MPAIASVLSQLMISKIAANIKYLAGQSPLENVAQPYFKQFCTALSAGIAGVTTLNFKTGDAGLMGIPPVPGTGTGIGVKMDASYMSEKMYGYIRESIIAKYGETLHEAWPPTKGNSGEYLKAFTDGISEAVKEHYETCWILTSNHTTVYMGAGVIDPTKYNDPSNRKNFTIPDISPVKSLILSSTGMLTGSFIPDFAEAVSKSLKDAVEDRAKGEVVIIGVCIPLVPPAGAQVCGVPGVGSGTGVAS